MARIPTVVIVATQEQFDDAVRVFEANIPRMLPHRPAPLLLIVQDPRIVTDAASGYESQWVGGTRGSVAGRYYLLQ